MKLSKRLYLLLSIAAFTIAWQMLQTPSSQAGPIIWFEIGRPSKNCTGLGICRGGVGAPTTINTGARSNGRTLNTTTSVAGQKLTIEFSSQLPEKGDTLTVEKDLALDAATSKQLGFRDATILQGEYRIDLDKGRFGAVTVNIKGRPYKAKDIDWAPAKNKTVN